LQDDEAEIKPHFNPAFNDLSWWKASESSR